MKQYTCSTGSYNKLIFAICLAPELLSPLPPPTHTFQSSKQFDWSHQAYIRRCTYYSLLWFLRRSLNPYSQPPALYFKWSFIPPHANQIQIRPPPPPWTFTFLKKVRFWWKACFGQAIWHIENRRIWKGSLHVLHQAWWAVQLLAYFILYLFYVACGTGHCKFQAFLCDPGMSLDSMHRAEVQGMVEASDFAASAGLHFAEQAPRRQVDRFLLNPSLAIALEASFFFTNPLSGLRWLHYTCKRIINV